jgi:hypothetical protein
MPDELFDGGYLQNSQVFYEKNAPVVVDGVTGCCNILS